MEDMTKLFDFLNGILNTTDFSDVTAEGAGFSELPDGYYLVEVEKAELKESKKSQNPMVAFQMKVAEDGYSVNEEGEYTLIPKTKNRKIFIYYLLKDETSVKRFATDMLKFEGEVEGEPILNKEYFTTSETLVDALEILEGLKIYVHCSTTENADGSSSTWRNLISWKRAKALELPQ